MLSERFDEALNLASRLHRAQMRKHTSIPYVSHLLIVAGTVIEQGGDEDTAIAALLHDAVEDQGGRATLELIERMFGPRVAGLVMEVTDAEVVPKPPWRSRKERYLAGMRAMSPEALLIAVADKLHNARSTLADYRLSGPAVWERFNANAEMQAWFYRAFLAAAGAHPGRPDRLLEELRGVEEALFEAAPEEREKGGHSCS